MAASAYARTSLESFVCGSSVILLPVLGLICESAKSVVSSYFWFMLFGHLCLVNGILLATYRGHAYQVAIRGCMLGVGFGYGIIFSCNGTSSSCFGQYLTALCFFHWSEYFCTAVTNPKHLSLSSYLLDHSREYHIAAVASWLEFWIEYYLFPSIKCGWLSVFGLVLVIGGEFLRKLAMLTARTNFNHYIQHLKHDDHELVTHGIYSLTRHPSYVGWFYWSVGTQILLLNPVCIIGYTVVSWKFFKCRIYEEELTLLNFFREDYLEYQKRVGTGLPFIHGYRINL